MKPIFSITLNPALDLGGMVDQLIPNEKNYVHHETRYPGGNGINAARIIHRLGIPVVTTGFLGGGVGIEIETLLTAENLTHDFIKISSPTRISLTVSNLNTHLQSRLSFAGPVINHSEWEKLTHHLDKLPSDGLAVIGGSLPPGVDVKLFTSLVAKLSQKGVQCIVDIPGKYLKEVCEAHPLLIKPNLLEFQELTGKKVTSKEDVIFEARKLLSKVSIVCISSVENGALLVTEDAAWFGRIPSLEIKTTVGAGDSMVGAMAAKLYEWKDLEPEKSYLSLAQARGHELLQWGLAASCATLIVTGTELGSAQDINKYYPEVMIEDSVSNHPPEKPARLRPLTK